MAKLDGKVAIVTGATSGIGERIAEVFVAEGARVVAAGRREAEGRALEAKCGPAMSFIRTDVTIEASVKAMVDHTVTRFGRLDCLVNNAGSGSPMVSITEVAAEHFSLVFDTNVRGVMFGMKHAAPVMIAQGSGSIITIASAAGLRGGFYIARPDLQESWEKPGLSAEARQHIKLTMLTLRFEHWKKDRILDLNNPVDRERKRLNALRNARR